LLAGRGADGGVETAEAERRVGTWEATAAAPPQHWAGRVRQAATTVGPVGRRLAGQGPPRGGSAR